MNEIRWLLMWEWMTSSGSLGRGQNKLTGVGVHAWVDEFMSGLKVKETVVRNKEENIYGITHVKNSTGLIIWGKYTTYLITRRAKVLITKS